MDDRGQQVEAGDLVVLSFPGDDLGASAHLVLPYARLRFAKPVPPRGSPALPPVCSSRLPPDRPAIGRKFITPAAALTGGGRRVSHGTPRGRTARPPRRATRAAQAQKVGSGPARADLAGARRRGRELAAWGEWSSTGRRERQSDPELTKASRDGQGRSTVHQVEATRLVLACSATGSASARSSR